MIACVTNDMVEASVAGIVLIVLLICITIVNKAWWLNWSWRHCRPLWRKFMQWWTQPDEDDEW